MLDLQQLGDPGDFLVNGGRRHLADLQAEFDVFPHAHGRVQRIGLEDHGDVAIFRAHAADVGLVDQDLTTGDVFQAGDAVHQGGLATARRTDKDQELAFLDL